MKKLKWIMLLLLFMSSMYSQDRWVCDSKHQYVEELLNGEIVMTLDLGVPDSRDIDYGLLSVPNNGKVTLVAIPYMYVSASDYKETFKHLVKEVLRYEAVKSDTFVDIDIVLHNLNMYADNARVKFFRDRLLKLKNELKNTSHYNLTKILAPSGQIQRGARMTTYLDREGKVIETNDMAFQADVLSEYMKLIDEVFVPKMKDIVQEKLSDYATRYCKYVDLPFNK